MILRPIGAGTATVTAHMATDAASGKRTEERATPPSAPDPISTPDVGMTAPCAFSLERDSGDSATGGGA